jgi:hypothetical protein
MIIYFFLTFEEQYSLSGNKNMLGIGKFAHVLN